MNSGENNNSRPSHHAAARAIRELVARARQGALGTLMADSKAPYVSLVNVASDGKEPLLFLSRLAWHTHNILAEDRACLLITKEDATGDVLAEPRVSLLGRLRRSESEDAREIYFSLHPNARDYAQFGDFNLFKLNVETAHYVAGFGQIITLEKTQLFDATG